MMNDCLTRLLEYLEQAVGIAMIFSLGGSTGGGGGVDCMKAIWQLKTLK